MTKREPDGWAVYSPKGILLNLRVSRASAEEAMAGVSRDNYREYESYIAMVEAVRNEMLEAGYRIEPICPVSPERLEELEAAWELQQIRTGKVEYAPCEHVWRSISTSAGELRHCTKCWKMEQR